MPILTDPKIDAPLTQGDLLVGLRLYATGNNWAECSGSCERLDCYNMCLVISRPCATIHKSKIIVAGVKAINEDLGDEDLRTFDKVRHFLNKLRDGQDRPDRFYLGQIPDLSTGRYYAHFDSLHCVALPPTEKLQEFLRTNRIATLAEEFRRDLHMRIFSSFASLGFDDFGWYTDRDLDWLVQKGRQNLNELRAELSKQEADLSALDASGGAKGRKEIEGRQKAIEKLRSEVNRFQDELQVYERQQEGRTGADG